MFSYFHCLIILIVTINYLLTYLHVRHQTIIINNVFSYLVIPFQRQIIQTQQFAYYSLRRRSSILRTFPNFDKICNLSIFQRTFSKKNCRNCITVFFRRLRSFRCHGHRWSRGDRKLRNNNRIPNVTSLPA